MKQFIEIVQKTKIMVFRNGGIIRGNESWIDQNEHIEILNQFSYLCMIFNFNGKLNTTQNHIADQGIKALFVIDSALKQFNFNAEAKCTVFDTYFNSILSYGSDV